MTQLTHNRYVELQKQLMLILSEMTAIDGQEEQALELKEMGEHAESFVKFDLNLDYEAHYLEDYTPKYGRNVKDKIVPSA